MLELWNAFVYVAITITFAFLLGILSLTFAELLMNKFKRVIREK